MSTRPRLSASQVCWGVHSSLSRKISVPPTASVVSQRSWAPSKANDMKCSSGAGLHLVEFGDGLAMHAQGPWLTATPLGTPVEPEV